MDELARVSLSSPTCNDAEAFGDMISGLDSRYDWGRISSTCLIGLHVPQRLLL